MDEISSLGCTVPLTCPVSTDPDARLVAWRAGFASCQFSQIENASVQSCRVYFQQHTLVLRISFI